MHCFLTSVFEMAPLVLLLIGRAQNRLGNGELENLNVGRKIYDCNVAQGFYDSYFRKCTSKGCHPKIIGGYSLLPSPSL